MPRVPSLDFLRALVVNQHPHSPSKLGPNPMQMSAGGSAMHVPSDLDISALYGLPALSPSLSKGHGASLAAAAAALGLQNYNGHHYPALPHMPHSSATSTAPLSSDGGRSGGELDDKAEARRARRMLSNRESARRSRRRKQEHMNKLEEELNQVEDSKAEIANQVSKLEARCSAVEDENRRFREENDRLKDELRFLRREISERNVLRRSRSPKNGGDKQESKKGHHEETKQASQEL